MTKTLHFVNPGELDLRLITLMGVNVKPAAASPIGHFGTGLKYALACILREEGEIEIFTSGKRVTFHPEPETIRGKVFQTVDMWIEDLAFGKENPGREPHIQKVRLAFTTELGKNWKPWMALRELWSNCKDEGGDAALVEEWPHIPSNLDTVIIVRGGAFLDAWELRSEFLLEGEAEVVLPGLEIHPGPSKSVFYHGIKVLDLALESLYTYNILSQEALTEDRTLPEWNARHAIATATTRLEDQAMAEIILSAGDSYWEGSFDYSYVGEFSKPFLAGLRNAQARKQYNRSARKRAYSDYHEDMMPVPLPRTGEQSERLQRAFQHLTSMLGDDLKWKLFHLFRDDDGEEFYDFGEQLYIRLDIFSGGEFLPKLLHFWGQRQGWREANLEHKFLQFYREMGELGNALEPGDELFKDEALLVGAKPPEEIHPVPMMYEEPIG